MDEMNDFEQDAEKVLGKKFTGVLERYDLEAREEWRKWCDEIPSMNFPEEWNVKIIPPFAGAIARFMVTYKDRRGSVYLDCYDRIGFFGEPYWEAYPIKGDTFRCKMSDTKLLIKTIKAAFKAKKSNEP